MSIKERIKNDYSRFHAAIIGGCQGGMIAGFVKWEKEMPLPPCTPDRAVPPAEVLKDFGFLADSMVYIYSECLVNWGSAGVPQLFSETFGHSVWAWTIKVFRQYYRDRYSAG